MFNNKSEAAFPMKSKYSPNTTYIINKLFIIVIHSFKTGLFFQENHFFSNLTGKILPPVFLRQITQQGVDKELKRNSFICGMGQWLIEPELFLNRAFKTAAVLPFFGQSLCTVHWCVLLMNTGIFLKTTSVPLQHFLFRNSAIGNVPSHTANRRVL